MSERTELILNAAVSAMTAAPPVHDIETVARTISPAVLRAAAELIDRGPDFPLPPSIYSTLLREYAEATEEPS